MSYRKFFLIAAAAVPLMMGVAAQAEEGPGHSSAPMQQAKQPSLQDLSSWHKSMCGERYAHETARLAYLQARLDLTEAQKPAFHKWADAVGQTAGLEHDACLANAPKATTPPSIIDRETAFATEMRIKLQGLENGRPALQALYEQLTPDQRAILDHPHGGPGGHHGEHFEGHGEGYEGPHHMG